MGQVVSVLSASFMCCHVSCMVGHLQCWTSCPMGLGVGVPSGCVGGDWVVNTSQITTSTLNSLNNNQHSFHNFRLGSFTCSILQKHHTFHGSIASNCQARPGQARPGQARPGQALACHPRLYQAIPCHTFAIPCHPEKCKTEWLVG